MHASPCSESSASSSRCAVRAPSRPAVTDTHARSDRARRWVIAGWGHLPARGAVHVGPAIEIVHQYQVGLHSLLHGGRRLLYPCHLQRQAVQRMRGRQHSSLARGSAPVPPAAALRPALAQRTHLYTNALASHRLPSPSHITLPTHSAQLRTTDRTGSRGRASRRGDT